MQKSDDYPLEIRVQAICLAEQIGVAKAASILNIPARKIYHWANHGDKGQKTGYSQNIKLAAVEQVSQKMQLASQDGFFDTQEAFQLAKDVAIYQTAIELGIRKAILERWLLRAEMATKDGSINYPCACCGYLVYGENPRGSYLICGICWWEADPVQEDLPEFAGGANSNSLFISRRNYFKVGVAETRYFLPTFKRDSPQEDEIPLGGNAFEAFYASLKPEFVCPCCRFKTFETEPTSTSHICPVCLWTVCRPFSEIYQDYPDWKPQFGEVDLEKAQTNFLKFGACLPELVPFVRPPLPEEIT